VSLLSGGCPDIVFTLQGRIVYSDRSTEFRKSRCGDLANGQDVKVKGQRYSDGRVRADRIEVEGRRDDDDDDEEDRD
jgi:Domain of unknown function (DUF5666)